MPRTSLLPCQTARPSWTGPGKCVACLNAISCGAGCDPKDGQSELLLGPDAISLLLHACFATFSWAIMTSVAMDEASEVLRATSQSMCTMHTLEIVKSMYSVFGIELIPKLPFPNIIATNTISQISMTCTHQMCELRQGGVSLDRNSLSLASLSVIVSLVMSLFLPLSSFYGETLPLTRGSLQERHSERRGDI